MTEVAFYQVAGKLPADVDAAVPSLLTKALAAGHRVAVRCPSAERLARLDGSLWGFESSAFLPHGPVNEPEAAHQPVVLTHEAGEAPNGADILLSLENASLDGLEKYARALVVFHSGGEILTAARLLWKELKTQDVPLTYYAQEGGRWRRKAG